MAKVTLDPGHDHLTNVSPTNKRYIEGVQMFKLAGYLKAALEDYGIEVALTRSVVTDNPMPLETRGKQAATNGSDLFISLHSNAPGKQSDGTYDTSISGTYIYYSLTDEDNKRLADKLGEVIASKMGHKFRGSLTREYGENRPDWDYYGVIRGAARNGCKAAYLIEHGFHTNSKDVSFLLSDSKLLELAQAEAKVIADHLGVTKKLYRVQIGAFSNKQNAELYKQKAIADGYKAFVVET